MIESVCHYALKQYNNSRLPNTGCYGGNVKKVGYVECECGLRVEAPVNKDARKIKCPRCGASLESKLEVSPVSVSDTQMINIHDMAKMAQDGVDVTVSGEWDTSEKKEKD